MGFWTLGEGIANLALSIYLAPRLGLIGVALGTTIPMLVTKLVIQPWYTLRIIGIPVKDYFVLSFLRPLLTTGIFLVVFLLVLDERHTRDFVSLILLVTIQAATFLLLGFFLALDADERRLLLRRFHGVVNALTGKQPFNLFATTFTKVNSLPRANHDTERIAAKLGSRESEDAGGL